MSSVQAILPDFSQVKGPAVQTDGVVVYSPSDFRGQQRSILLGDASPRCPLSADPRWLDVLSEGLGQAPYFLAYRANGNVLGTLQLMLVDSLLFGRFLVSLPYVNSAGVQAASPEVGRELIDRAAQLADRLNVRYLELRHEVAQEHPALTQAMASKVHMRLALPPTPDKLWTELKAKVRNQIRKGESYQCGICWGQVELLDDFYSVLCRNMRDLGTPVFGRKLFESILAHFRNEAEICVVKHGNVPAAAALLLHGAKVTEVPTASSLRSFNSTNVNMLMYWHLLARAIERGQNTFDFGRSTIDGSTYKFKRQWGAMAHPATWQYYVRRGSIGDMRPENGKYKLAINVWRRLPIWVTRLVGPSIVRCIP
jgi:FemAB-related protein (PEP-CTERM system-associated)